MDLTSRVDHMDEEFKLLKNEIKQVLLEVQEHVLNVQNPFISQGNFAPQRAPQPAPAIEPPPPPPPPSLAQPIPTPVLGIVENLLAQGALGGPGLEPEAAGGPGPGPEEPRRNGRRSAAKAAPARRAATAVLEELEEDEPGGPGLGPDLDDSFDDEDDERDSRRGPSPGGIRLMTKADRNTRLPKSSQSREENNQPEEEETDMVTHSDPKLDQSATRPEKGGDRALRALDPQKEGANKERTIDLVTIAGMAQWCDRALRRIGRENFDTLVQVSEKTGRVSKEAKEILLALVPLFDGRDSKDNVSAKEIVSLLAQLDGLLAGGPMTDARMLPFLLQDDMDIFPLMRP